MPSPARRGHAGASSKRRLPPRSRSARRRPGLPPAWLAARCRHRKAAFLQCLQVNQKIGDVLVALISLLGQDLAQHEIRPGGTSTRRALNGSGSLFNTEYTIAPSLSPAKGSAPVTIS